MQTESTATSNDPRLGRIAKVLRGVGWTSFGLQLVFQVASVIVLALAVSGRTFSRQLGSPLAPGGVTQTANPGLGVGIFWGFAGIVASLAGIYLAFRVARLGRRLQHPNPLLHPKKPEVLKLIRWGVIAGMVGLGVTIIGGGASLGVLLAKSIAQPQGVAIYDPTRIIRSLDIFVAMANMNGITAHFVGLIAAMGLWEWLHRQS